MNGNWISDIPTNYWVFGNNISIDKDLKTALYLDGKNLNVLPPNRFVRAMNEITFEKNLPWEKILPAWAYKEWVETLHNQISEAFKVCSLSYYENVYKRSRELLEALSPMRIHKDMWDIIYGSNVEGINKKVIGSFKPNEQGFVKKIEYTLLETISGRLKIKNGPEILRLNKEFKSIIKSRYKNGKIYQFDYVSLEPRLALILTGRKVGKDIYQDINKEVFDGKLSRNIVKLATLSVMYGAGVEKLANETNLELSECRSIIKQLKIFFGVFSMMKKLNNEYKKYGIIRNHFGRAIYVEDSASHKLYNHFIQSSAVDAALLGFWNIWKFIEKDNIKPIFIIHDNMGLDFSKDMISSDKIEEIIEIGGKINGLDDRLLFSCDTIS